MSNLITSAQIQNFIENYKAHVLTKEQADDASNHDMRRTVMLQIGAVIIDANCFNDDNQDNVYNFLHILVDLYENAEINECLSSVFDFAVNLSKLRKIATFKFNKDDYERFLKDIIIRDDCIV